MSRMTTSCASFSWARPAIRLACSSGVSVSSVPSCSTKESLAWVSVETQRLDQVGDGRRNEPVDRLAACHAVANLARRDRNRLDLEQLDALGLREPAKDFVERLARIP